MLRAVDGTRSATSLLSDGEVFDLDGETISGVRNDGTNPTLRNQLSAKKRSQSGTAEGTRSQSGQLGYPKFVATVEPSELDQEITERIHSCETNWRKERTQLESAERTRTQSGTDWLPEVRGDRRAVGTRPGNDGTNPVLRNELTPGKNEPNRKLQNELDPDPDTLVTRSACRRRAVGARPGNDRTNPILRNELTLKKRSQIPGTRRTNSEFASGRQAKKRTRFELCGTNSLQEKTKPNGVLPNELLLVPIDHRLPGATRSGSQ